MGILKYGIIGFLVFIPILIIGQISIRQHQSEQTIIRYLESQIEEAGYDAAFAMKTFTTGFYNSDNIYQIDVDEEAVIQVFYDSLEFRRLPISNTDFSALIIVGYDGVVIYNPVLDCYNPKVHYIHKEGMKTHYYNLSSQYLSYDSIEDEVVVKDVEDEDLYYQTILGAIQKALSQNELISGRDLHIDYIIPSVKVSLFKQGVADMAFIPLFESQTVLKGRTIAFYNIAPSGVMKIHQESIDNY